MIDKTQESKLRPARRSERFKWRVLMHVAGFVLLGFFVVNMPAQAAVQQLSYTQFKHAVQQGRVAVVTLHQQKIYGQFTAKASKQNQAQKQASEQPGGGHSEVSSPLPSPNVGVDRATQPRHDFVTTRPALDGVDLMSLLEKNGVNIRVETDQPSTWAQILDGLLPWLLVIAAFAFIIWFMRRRTGGGQGSYTSFGHSRAKRHRVGTTGVMMNRVAGADNAKGDVEEIIDYLSNPGRYHRLGAKIPSGVLLMGPPGTGKTLLAKAVAGEANVPFYSISGSEFIEMFVGVGASRVRNMFKNAREEAPAIIFIDELDAVGRSRGAGVGSGHNEQEQTLNQILSEMDGFEAGETVVVIAATNRPDVLDPALLRPGRFDRKIVVERPHRAAREAILGVHVRNKPLADDVDLSLLAQRTAGFSGADLGNLVNEAALFAGRQSEDGLTMACFSLARDKVLLGAPREEQLTDQDRKVTAYHECGHALLAQLLPNAEPPDRVTIIPRGQALGATEQNPTEERYNMTESDLRDRVGVMLGGRTAEKLIFGEVSTGAQQDLKQATDLVRKMVSEWGMSERLGVTSFPGGETQSYLGQGVAQRPNCSENTAELMDTEIRRILDGIDDEVTRLLNDNKPALDALAKQLLQDDTLGRREIQRVLEGAVVNASDQVIEPAGEQPTPFD